MPVSRTCLVLVLVAEGAFALGAGEPLRIGLLDSTGPYTEEIAAGAMAATVDLNAKSEINGRQIELYRLPAARPWRDFASRTADLVFQHDLAVLIGPSDDAAAHLAAQIATRKRIPLIVLSSEASLTAAADPWVFRGVPDDREQARLLLRWVLPDPRGKRAVVVVPQGRAGRERSSALEKACGGLGVEILAVVHVAESVPKGADVLMLWLDSEAGARFLESIDPTDAPPNVIMTYGFDDEEFLLEPPIWAQKVALPRLRVGAETDPGWALGNDMVRLIAEAARNGTEPARIRENLAEMPPFVGKSGTFDFDRSGNRRGSLPIQGFVRTGLEPDLDNASPEWR